MDYKKNDVTSTYCRILNVADGALLPAIKLKDGNTVQSGTVAAMLKNILNDSIMVKMKRMMKHDANLNVVYLFLLVLDFSNSLYLMNGLIIMVNKIILVDSLLDDLRNNI
jgi:hypothetical protein